ncbi:hypothetical protein H206_06351 [Candidatus Electrothrix aarhusensis]|uniref:Uncharacterized protein n=1 Tax=Candidatus Electrothrix aarhusensis TaxID=1859131 RepID=A0A444J2Y0_9BACT|nr:hypothetical protein H206_06351 [Candidatus Electrothrix aarhusensis]
MSLKSLTVELSTEHIAQGVPLKGTTNLSCKPVDVLQNSIAIIRRMHPEILLKASMPGIREIFDGQLAF